MSCSSTRASKCGQVPKRSWKESRIRRHILVRIQYPLRKRLLCFIQEAAEEVVLSYGGEIPSNRISFPANRWLEAAIHTGSTVPVLENNYSEEGPRNVMATPALYGSKSRLSVGEALARAADAVLREEGLSGCDAGGWLG